MNIFPNHFFSVRIIYLFFLCSAKFVDKIIRGNTIYKLFHQLVFNMGKYLPQEGKVSENNLCLTALVIFAGLSGFRQTFTQINHKLMKSTQFPIQNVLKTCLLTVTHMGNILGKNQKFPEYYDKLAYLDQTAGTHNNSFVYHRTAVWALSL